MDQRYLWQFCIFFICFLQVFSKDYYEILGVKRDANDKEIKRKFRQLALKYHPDKNKETKAEETFRSIAEAYDVLSDPAKRREYDLQGHQTFTSTSNFNSETQSGFRFNMNDFFKHFDTDPMFYSSNFEQFDFGEEFLDDDDGDNVIYDDHQYEFADFFPRFAQSNDHFVDEQMFFQPSENCRTVTRQHGHTVSTITECY